MHETQPGDEHELLSRTATGDRHAFTLLYTRYLDDLYRYVFLFTHSKQDSEEIIQEVFIRIWETRSGLEQVRSFGNYLFQSARNKIIDHVRRRQTARKVAVALSGENPTSPETPVDVFDYRVFNRKLQDAVAALPPRRQQIFRLHVEQGLSYDEISARLAITKAAVKKQLYEAYEQVQDRLDT
jgi:RNA polymerase sigma-70 factor (family 1)